jgi:hypothetical protein
MAGQKLSGLGGHASAPADVVCRIATSFVENRTDGS